MNRQLDSRRAGVAAGDVLVVLSLLSLVFAIVYPRIQRSAYEERIEQVAVDVEALRTASQQHRDREGAWPAGSAQGGVPAELVGSLPMDFAVSVEHYTLDWNLWEIVSNPPEAAEEEEEPDFDPDAGAVLPPQTVVEGPDEPAIEVDLLPGITVHSDDPALLAALLERYGPTLSFVRDGSWTLILRSAESP